MRIAKWRIALVGAAIVALGAFGVGMVSAAPPSTVSAAAPVAQALPGIGRFERMRHLVHGVATFQKADGTLVTVQADHGTIAAIGGGTLTIAEAGGGSQTVTTNADTRVRKDGKKSDLSKLAVGDNVFVASELQGSTPIAKLIVVPRPLPVAQP